MENLKKIKNFKRTNETKIKNGGKNSTNNLLLNSKLQTPNSNLSHHISQHSPLISYRSGITLIALVVTIVILLILAAITINLVLAEGGLFERAGQASEEQKKAEIKEKIELVKADWLIDKATKQGINEEHFFEKLIKAEIVEEREDIQGPEQEGENKIYTATTKEGYQVEIIVDGKGNITIGDIEKDGISLPKITKINVINISKTSVTVKANVRRLNGGTISYYYKLSTDKEYKPIKTNAAEGEKVTQEGLTEGETYDIKVEATNENGTSEPMIIQITAKDIVVATELRLNKTSAKIALGQTLNLNAIISPESATIKEVTWTSSNTNVATISSATGTTVTVTAKELGTTIIEAKTTDGSNLSASCEITVREVKPDTELEALLKEANMTITLEDILNTPAIMNEVAGLIPIIKETDVTREVVDGVITYRDSTGGIIRTTTEFSDGTSQAWRAFDNDTSTGSASISGGAAGYYLEYEFSEEVYAMQIKYMFSNGSSFEGTRNLVIQGYDEENDIWEDLTGDLKWTGTINNIREEKENLDYTNPYKNYRIYVKNATYTSNSIGGSLSGIRCMQLYGVNETAKTEEEKKQALLANSNLQEITLSNMVTNKEFTERLIHALSIETVTNNELLMENLPGLIPVITESDVTKEEIDGVITYTDHTGGKIKVSSEYSTSYAWKAFDNDINTNCGSGSGNVTNYYLEYEFLEEVYAIQIKYIFTNGASAEGTRIFVIQGYDEENETWENLTEDVTWTGNANTKREDKVNLEYSKAYKKYKLYVKTATYTSHSNGALWNGLHSMQLYGKKAN